MEILFVKVTLIYGTNSLESYAVYFIKVTRFTTNSLLVCSGA